MDITEQIKSSVKDLYKNTPETIKTVFISKKIVDGKKTDIDCITFGVDKKKSLNELTENDYIVPKNLEINNQILKTDVVEFPELKGLICYDWTANPLPPEIVAHRSRQRPLKGGVVISVDPFQWVGTLGLICVDKTTEALVGLTNLHVAVGIPQGIFPSNQSEVNSNSYNTLVPRKRIIQFTEGQTVFNSDIIGYVKNYIPFKTGINDENYIDAATCSIKQCDSSIRIIDNKESLKQLGINYNSPMPFATTEEINNLITNTNYLYSAGRTTGPKGTENCRMECVGLGGNTPVTFGSYSINFYDVIYFVYDENNNTPVIAGDSGSILIADIDGIFKIVGLVFAGGGSIGVACRIDHVSQMLNLKAWDGNGKNYINNGNISYLTKSYTQAATGVQNTNSRLWSLKETVPNSGEYWFAGFVPQTGINAYTQTLENIVCPPNKILFGDGLNNKITFVKDGNQNFRFIKP